MPDISTLQTDVFANPASVSVDAFSSDGVAAVRPVPSLLGRLRTLTDSWLGAMLGAAVYGGWATWANWPQGASTAIKIGLTHWLASMLLTHYGTVAMRVFAGRSGGITSALRAGIGGLLLTYLSLLMIHSALGTEHLLVTLLPGIIPNILFCSGYALLLLRTEPSQVKA